MNDPGESSYVFNYDSNGNLISEKEESYSDFFKHENDITYTINGSTVTAQQISKRYNNSDGTLFSITTSTITYTLDTKKRPIRKVVVSEEKDSTGNITLKENKTFTYQYANHYSFLETTKGMDKLTYSSFVIGSEDVSGVYLPISYINKERNSTFYYAGSPHFNDSYTGESKVEYTLNTNNYPTKIQRKTKDIDTGQYINSDYYYTIEYNR